LPLFAQLVEISANGKLGSSSFVARKLAAPLIEENLFLHFDYDPARIALFGSSAYRQKPWSGN
jgi:hypothetical protein